MAPASHLLRSVTLKNGVLRLGSMKTPNDMVIMVCGDVKGDTTVDVILQGV
jgi:hypothetical protein